MKELFPEQYGLAGHELAAAAMVKFYINEVGAKAELKNIIGSEVDGAALADLIDRAAAYCAERTKGSNVEALMQEGQRQNDRAEHQHGDAGISDETL